jgi:fido (protein-threonine AMPylation protein)
MNERIRELSKEAWSWAEQRDYLDPTEKFAELIVRECANVNYNSPFQDGEFHAREVLEHFGVEE